jgi:Icc-related predicted phosphoesterase
MKKPLRILGLADLHDNWTMLDQLKDIDADIIAFCGDLHNASLREEARQTARALENLGSIVLIVPGNMDRKDVVLDIWSESGFVMLHQSSFRSGDYGFLGMGGMVARNPLRLGDPTKYYHHDEDVYLSLAKTYPDISGAKFKIIVTHQPPRGAQDTLYNGESSGSISLRRFVEDFQPQLLLCGHIHEDMGESHLGATKVINVGELRRGYAALIKPGNVTTIEWIRLK